MNGISYLLDTNIIIGMYQRNVEVMALMQAKHVNISQCAYSGITRMELLSFPGITEKEELAIKNLLDRRAHLSVSPIVEELTIQFRRLNKTKLPDAIIAATAKAHAIELLTLDKKLSSKL